MDRFAKPFLVNEHKLTLHLSKLTVLYGLGVKIVRTSKVSLGLRPESGAWLSPPVKCIMID